MAYWTVMELVRAAVEAADSPDTADFGRDLDRLIDRDRSVPLDCRCPLCRSSPIDVAAIRAALQSSRSR